MAKIPNHVHDEAAVYMCDMMSRGFAGAEAADIPIGGGCGGGCFGAGWFNGGGWL